MVALTQLHKYFEWRQKIWLIRQLQILATTTASEIHLYHLKHQRILCKSEILDLNSHVDAVFSWGVHSFVSFSNL